MQNIVIVGTGLIGASFGLALRKAGFTGAITGVSSPRAIADALAVGAIDRGASLEAAVPEAAPRLPLADHRPHSRYHPPPRSPAPPRHPGHRRRQHQVRYRRSGAPDPDATPSFWAGIPWPARRRAAPPPRTRTSSAAAPGSSRPTMLPNSTPPPPLEFRMWLHRIGAHVLTLDADEHDRVVSLTSHLAQLASTALAATVSDKLGAPPRLRRRRPRPGGHDASRHGLLRNLARHPRHQ